MESEKNQIKNALEAVRKGVTSQNWQLAEKHIANDWVTFQSGGKFTWEDQKGMFSQNISEHESTFHVEKIEIARDGNMAVCFSSEETNYKFGGEKVHENALFTTIWRKEGDTWKMFHLDRSVNPAQMPEKLKEMMAEMV